MNDLHLIVREQFPEFVRSEYPVFLEFVKAYYKWMELQSIGKIEDVVDIDNTPDRFVTFFRQQLDQHGLLHHVVPFNRLYIQKIKQIYNTKGSEQALANLLRIAFQANTVVRYPSENILRASDGRWDQESFIVVEQTYGMLPTTITEFFIQYDQTDVRVELSRYEIIEEGVVRLFFKPNANISATERQLVYVHDSTGSVVYAGRVARLPVKIDIIRGGLNWQLGQVITIPGTIRDTVARVADVTAAGEILHAEIIQYGYNHTENQTLITTPYPNKPLGASFDVTIEQTSNSPIKFLYTLEVNDYLDGITDRVQGVSSGVNPSSYFLQDYVTSGYAGYTAFDNVTTVAEYGEGDISDITIEQWLASRATLSYTYGTQVTERGQWTSDAGIISNENIRLQDNFYYQQFSYDIEADINSTKYIDLAKAIHPTGTKAFTTYALGEVLEIEPIATTSFPFIKLDLFDNALPIDANKKLTTKNPSDTAVVLDFDKQVLIKRPTDSVTLTDVDKQIIVKNPEETLTVADADALIITKQQSETLVVSDTTVKTYNKYLVDSATASSPDTSSFEVIQYNVESYFGEDYVRTDKNLTLGA